MSILTEQIQSNCNILKEFVLDVDCTPKERSMRINSVERCMRDNYVNIDYVSKPTPVLCKLFGHKGRKNWEEYYFTCTRCHVIVDCSDESIIL